MERKNTREKDSWDAFFSTGKVEDYLRYASCKEGSMMYPNAGENSIGIHEAGENFWGESTESVGEKPYAGFYSGNRNHTEANSYR